MDTTIFVLRKREKLIPRLLLEAYYEDVDEIPQEIWDTLKIEKYIHVDVTELESHFSTKIEKLCRKQARETRRLQRQKQQIVQKICDKYLTDAVVESFAWEENGPGIENDNMFHYCSCDLELNDEFDLFYNASFDLSIDMNGKKRHARLEIDIDQQNNPEFDGHDKVFFFTQTSVILDENLSKSIPKKQAIQLIKEICEEFIKDFDIQYKIFEKIWMDDHYFLAHFAKQKTSEQSDYLTFVINK